jgi:hypothetical protein
MSGHPTSRGPVRTRAQLKAYFSNGKVPDETQFAALIDSFVLPSEVMAPPAPAPAPDPDAALRAAGLRIGRFDPTAAGAFQPLPAGTLRPACKAAADGSWQELLCGLNGCFAFEVVACASGQADSGLHAVTHATALTSFGGGHLRQTFSAPHVRRWRWLPCWLRRPRFRVEFRWQSEGRGLSLWARTSCDFGSDEEGRPVMIDYHLSRLW